METLSIGFGIMSKFIMWANYCVLSVYINISVGMIELLTFSLEIARGYRYKQS